MTLYLYGFVEHHRRPPPDDLPGVGGGPVRLVDLGSVAAAVSDVPEEEFDAGTVEARLHDLDWVSEQGALHERVVTWFVDEGGILPARFLTLHSSERALRGEAGPRSEEIAGRLEALKGLREWDLKVSCREETLRERIGEVSEEVAELDRELREAAPGRRYLLERKRDGIVRREASRAAERMAREAFGELAGEAAGARRLARPTSAEGVGVVLNAALLVARRDERDVQARAAEIRERLARLGLDLTLTGPWAPYRFVSPSADEPAAERR